jgi:hypothetical protein
MVFQRRARSSVPVPAVGGEAATTGMEACSGGVSAGGRRQRAKWWRSGEGGRLSGGGAAMVAGNPNSPGAAR